MPKSEMIKLLRVLQGAVVLLFLGCTNLSAEQTSWNQELIIAAQLEPKAVLPKIDGLGADVQEKEFSSLAAGLPPVVSEVDFKRGFLSAYQRIYHDPDFGPPEIVGPTVEIWVLKYSTTEQADSVRERLHKHFKDESPTFLDTTKHSLHVLYRADGQTEEMGSDNYLLVSGPFLIFIRGQPRAADLVLRLVAQEYSRK